MSTTIKFRRGVASAWTQLNPILAEGEPGYETDTRKEKRGDGFTPWNNLPYVYDPEAISKVESVLRAELNTHINDPTPHSAYDDGPSLVLLYQNAKV
jgi:hypothetical protein